MYNNVFSKFFDFKKNLFGVLSLLYISFIFLISIFTYLIAPDSSSNSNNMNVSIHSKEPGFKIDILEIDEDTTSQSFFDLFLFGSKKKINQIPVSYYKIEKNRILYREFNSNQDKLKEIPFNNTKVYSKTFLLGTDKFGRDVLSRIIVGSRISFYIGFVSVFISLVIGIFLGSLAGYYSGIIDTIIMWIINIVWSIPTLLLVIAISLALGKGVWQVFLAVGLTMWVEVARLVRGQVKQYKERKFVVAAKVIGLSDMKIIFRHIIPNLTSSLIVISATNFAASILIESGLSFLGIGVQPPMSSWGLMIKDHYNYIILGKAYLAIIPGLCIMLLVSSFMILGNSIERLYNKKYA
jgi:peptide/nickel transport system permease protein